MQLTRSHQQINPNFRFRLANYFSVPPAVIALGAQVAAIIVASLVVYQFFMPFDTRYQLGTWIVLQGATSAFIAYLCRLSLLWVTVNLLFFPTLIAGLSLRLNPIWPFSLFLILGAVYWNAFRAQVPLFLSSKKAKEVIATLLPNNHEFSFLDIGCGLGGCLRYLKWVQPRGKYFGVETAPLPFFIAYIINLFSKRKSHIRLFDFWKLDLSKFDVVYAYLSPAPMPALWEKITREMQSGSLFISNSFAVPGVPADFVIDVKDGTRSTLYVWRIAPKKSS